jgi:hypothetical protein
MKKTLFLLMTVCAFFFAACSGGGGSKGPTKAVETYLAAIKAGKYEKAIDCFDGENFGGKEQMKMFVGKMEQAMNEQGGLKSYEIVAGSERISDDGNTAYVTATMVYGNGNTDETEFKLKNIDGNWMIDPSVK